MIKEESKFPVAFEDGLGKLLDKVYSTFKKGDKNAEEREQEASRAIIVLSKYRANITDQAAVLEKGDNENAPMLKNALHEIESLVRGWSRNSAPSVDARIWGDCEMYLNRWEEAKKASQRAFKELPKDALLYLKSEKYDAYPLKFNRGIGAAVKSFKKITSSNESLTKLRNEVALAITAYRADIGEVRKKYERLIPKFERRWEDVLEPLENALTDLENGIANNK